VVRRGYGQSQGSYVEGSGGCAHPNYRAAGAAAAADIVATIAFMGGQAHVDATRVMLVGVSAGGFASIAAAAQRPPGLVAVLNFAGGRGSDAPDSVCQPDALVEAYGAFGRTVRVPTLWLYADNDHFFAPALAQRFFASFQAAGGTGTFVKLPAFGADGHLLLSDAAIPLWRDRVDAFLREHRLPTWAKPVVEAPATLPAPHGLSSNGREAFAHYLTSSNFEKAFAVDGAGSHYGWASGRRSPAEAVREALDICAKHAPDCRPYAINDAPAR
jgi:dienelactone hydrolase